MSDIRVLPIVPLKNTQIFPIFAYPVSIVRDQTIRAVEYIEDEQLMAVFFPNEILKWIVL